MDSVRVFSFPSEVHLTGDLLGIDRTGGIGGQCEIALRLTSDRR